MKKIYIIGIGGIGISAIARYYLEQGYQVFGSDAVNSELIEKLIDESCNIIIGIDENRINNNLDLVVYTEAIPNNNPELLKAKELNIKTITYPEALAEIANKKKLITIAGTHGKSTTTSLTSIVLKNSEVGVNAVIGTILKEFEGKNTHFSDSEYFVVEACEYKRSFLKYKPSVAVIVNIDLDHLDYYKDLDDYLLAYKQYLDNVVTGGFAILNGEDQNCKKLIGLRNDIKYIEVYNDYYTIASPLLGGDKVNGVENSRESTLGYGEGGGEKFEFEQFSMQIPGNHILFDAKIAYVIGQMAGIHIHSIIESLESYNGVWRRMEYIGKTENGNIIMSDYGHHPTEISLTLKAIREKYGNNKILTIFQPHQYNRTLELIEDFKNCFKDTDNLIVPNIYESRDSEEDKKKINSEKFINLINHPNKTDGKNFENTLKLINEFDKNNNDSVIILMGAGDVDDLRHKIKTV